MLYIYTNKFIYTNKLQFMQDKKNCGSLNFNSLLSISPHISTLGSQLLGRIRCAVVEKGLSLVGSSEVSKDFFDFQCSLCASGCRASRYKHSAWHGGTPL